MAVYTIDFGIKFKVRMVVYLTRLMEFLRDNVLAGSPLQFHLRYDVVDVFYWIVVHIDRAAIGQTYLNGVESKRHFGCRSARIFVGSIREMKLIHLFPVKIPLARKRA